MAKKKKRGRPKFTAQLRKAVEALGQSAEFVEPHSYHLYSLSREGGRFHWLRLMGSDGLLLAEHRGPKVSAEDPPDVPPLLIGFIIQSEDGTSQTKPNPFGKAAAAISPLGLWVDTVERGANKVVRRRLDASRVLLVVPKPKNMSAKAQAKFRTAATNVRNVVKTIQHADSREMALGSSVGEIQAALKSECRAWLKGRGRPRENR